MGTAASLPDSVWGAGLILDGVVQAPRSPVHGLTGPSECRKITVRLDLEGPRGGSDAVASVGWRGLTNILGGSSSPRPFAQPRGAHWTGSGCLSTEQVFIEHL